MSGDIRISVVLASYNGGRYIGAQLRSLLAGMADCDEIVVSDDASTDDTLDVVRAIGDSRVRVLPFKERVGYQRNFERAIREARGRYIFFSDQDDICLPERIPLSLNALQRSSFVCADATVVDEELNPLSSSYFAWRKVGNFGALQLFVHPDVVGATMACSKEFLTKALPLPVGVPHDQWLSVLAAAKGQLGVIRQPVILYRRHASVTSLSGLTGVRRSITIVARERFRLLAALAQHSLGGTSTSDMEVNR